VKFAALFLAGLSFAAQAQTLEPARCVALRHHGDPDARNCYQNLTRSRDPGVQAEGYWGIRDYKAANEAFKAAIKAKEKDPYLRVRWGRLYMEHWQPADASDLFGEALAIQKDYAPALLGEALVAAESFEGKSAELAEAALKSDPKLYEARELLAKLALEDNNPEKSAVEAKKALDIYPEALDAMAILATIDWMDDKTTTPWIDKILKINPMYGEAYETAGHFFVINRRYDEGIRAYRKAIELNPSLYTAKSELGINLMRFGRDGEARQLLEDSYNNGYQAPSVTNSLKLLDTYKNYTTIETPKTILRLDRKEADLLKLYYQPEFERALATYEKKYKYKLNQPVQLEVFPNHEDFAVRTMGLPGLGALGVTFGTVVAMDSPSSRKPGTFHWDSTMWHELSHVYILTMTNSRVPRWFTEGLAVFEETAASPDWGDRLDPPTIMAIKEHKLLPVAELDRGFIHPTYENQVIVSYFQGGKICNFINEKWGFDKILAMVEDFKNLEPTPAVIEKEFKMKPEEFDKQFLAWLDTQTKKTVDGFDEWKTKIRGVSEDAKAKKWDDVIKDGNAIRDLYADYVEAGSVYEFLSEAWLAKGDKAKAVAELERYSTVGGRDPVLLKQLSALQVEQGRKKEAAATLQRLNLIYLKDDEAHQRLGDLYLDLGNTAGAITEFRAVLAGSPIDLAGAHYQLARALHSAHRDDEARDEVIGALEGAPGFKPAQKLLLELTGKE
jgi:tetratricopeptide (TPR) repeat protein